MYTARTIWIVETLVSLGLMASIASQLSGNEAGSFIVAELVLFVIAFFVALRLGPGKVLAIGIGLGFALATLIAGASGGCIDSDIICIGPGGMFALGLILAGALYPGWALGTGLGTLARMTSIAERSSR
jgi:integral membrane sensor domain MASE1